MKDKKYSVHIFRFELLQNDRKNAQCIFVYVSCYVICVIKG